MCSKISSIFLAYSVKKIKNMEEQNNIVPSILLGSIVAVAMEGSTTRIGLGYSMPTSDHLL